MRNLRAILFVSSATRHMDDLALTQFVEQIRRRHGQDGITGAMLHNGGNFMFYLEGDPDSLDRSMAAMQAGGEQKGFITLIDDPLNERLFGAWVIGSAQPTESEMLALATRDWDERCRARRQQGPKPAELAVLENFWSDSRPGGL